MFHSLESATTLEKIPVASFFYVKSQNSDMQLAFMAFQPAGREGDFEGAVVLRLPADGSFTLPQPLSSYQLAIGAVIPNIVPLVDSDSIHSSSTEAFGMRRGHLILAGKEYLLPIANGDMDSDSYVSLTTGRLHLKDDAGDWLAFTRWELRARLSDENAPALFTSAPFAGGGVLRS